MIGRLARALTIALATSTTGMLHAQGLTVVPGVKVGHHTLDGRPTGCTVILIENGAVGGVDVRGGSPGTRETDLLRSEKRFRSIS